MLTNRYLSSAKNLPTLMSKIVDGAAPEKFTTEHLRGIGLTSSNDRAMIPLLKDLGFLTADGSPTQRYMAYRDKSRSKAVLGEALREAYADLFHINESPSSADRAAVEGMFRSKLNSGERVAQQQAATFFSLLGMADLQESADSGLQDTVAADPARQSVDVERPSSATLSTELHYTIQVHLPATKDLEVYNAIFRSLRENLLA